MKKIKNKRLDQTMEHLLDNRRMSDDSFTEYAYKGDNLVYLEHLKSLQAIDYKYASLRSKHLYDLRILDKGTLYFYNKHEARKNFCYGFLSGSVTGIIVTVIGELLLTCIRLKLGI